MSIVSPRFHPRPSLSPRVLIAGFSLLVLICVSLYFRFSQDPPKLANLLTGTKPGIIILDGPDRVPVSQAFRLSVIVDTKKQNTNAVGIYLRFDPKQLQIVNLDTAQSFCQFYPEKKFDNYHGTLSIACGSPHPGVSGTNTIVNLEFMPVVVGTTTIFTGPDSRILLSDGKGTNILTEFPNKQINVHSSL